MKIFPYAFVKRVWVILTVLVSPFTSRADLHIQVFDPPITLYSYPVGTIVHYPLDMNQDGIVEINFEFLSTSSLNYYQGAGVELFIDTVHPQRPQAQIGPGIYIGAIPEFSGEWQHSIFGGGFGDTSPPFYEVNGLDASFGPWQNTRAYLAIRFPSAEGTHYGWIDFEVYNFPVGTIHGIGYETTPGQGLFTPAAIPEPSSLLLLIGGGTLVILRRRHGRAEYYAEKLSRG